MAVCLLRLSYITKVPRNLDFYKKTLIVTLLLCSIRGRTSVVFRQLRGFQRQVCPNIGRLQTAQGISKANVSEHCSSSDSSGDFKGKSVRTLVVFRQLPGFQRQVCPNIDCLRTAFGISKTSVSKLLFLL